MNKIGNGQTSNREATIVEAACASRMKLAIKIDPQPVRMPRINDYGVPSRISTMQPLYQGLKESTTGRGRKIIRLKDEDVSPQDEELQKLQ